MCFSSRSFLRIRTFWRFPLGALLGTARVHVVVASWLDVFSQLTTQRANVSNQLAHLAIGNLVTKRRHAVRASFDDGRVNIFRVFTIDPFLIHQWWSNTPATVEVTAATVVLHEAPLAFVGIKGAFVGRVLHRLRETGSAWMNVAHRD